MEQDIASTVQVSFTLISNSATFTIRKLPSTTGMSVDIVEVDGLASGHANENNAEANQHTGLFHA